MRSALESMRSCVYTRICELMEVRSFMSTRQVHGWYGVNRALKLNKLVPTLQLAELLADTEFAEDRVEYIFT